MSRSVSGRLRVAVAGAGLMGGWHVSAARRAGADVIAIADPHPVRTASFAGRGLAVFTGVAEMLDAARPDVLHICTPTPSHGDLLALAAARGIHVLAEKPMAADVAQTQAVLDAARAAGILICPVHQYAFQNSVERILRDRGRAGAPVLVELAFFSAGAAGQPAAALAGIAADILPHPVSILQRLFPGAVPGAAEWQITTSAPGTHMLTTCTGATLLRISLSLTARPTCATMGYWGSRGGFAVDHFHDYALFRDGTASRRSKMTRPFSDGFGHLGLAATNLAARALRGEPAYPGLVALFRRFYAAVSGAATGGGGPISGPDILAGAALRDHFRAVTQVAPLAGGKGA